MSKKKERQQLIQLHQKKSNKKIKRKRKKVLVEKENPFRTVDGKDSDHAALLHPKMDKSRSCVVNPLKSFLVSFKLKRTSVSVCSNGALSQAGLIAADLHSLFQVLVDVVDS